MADFDMGNIGSYFDITQLVLYVFWFFFAGLVLYLHREGKREGYPLETDGDRRVEVVGFPGMPRQKTYTMEDGHSVTVPAPNIEERPIAAEPAAPWPGAPLVPTGDPMADGVGPASYALREERPERTHHGDPLIAPLRVLPDYGLSPRDPDPRGYEVAGLDDEVAGTVEDVWIDRTDPQVRFLEVAVGASPAPEAETPAPEAAAGDEAGVEPAPVEAPVATAPVSERVLLPINFAHVVPRQRLVQVRAVTGAQLKAAPRIASEAEVTLREEDRISAYFASGFLYATAEREEPLV